jgi:hypothetical protein
MKNLHRTKYFLFFLLISIGITSCTKDKSANNFKAKALKNGDLWGAPQVPFFLRGKNNDSLHIRFYTVAKDATIQQRKTEYAEQLDFVNIPFKEGDFSLEYFKFGSSTHTNPTVTFSVVDYDVILHKYELDSTDNNSFISVDEISEERKEFTGTFEATFILDETYSGPPTKEFPKVIEFSGGTYSAKEGW